jgi:hypothetical protein
LVLRSILRPDGAPMGGIHCYQNVGQVRNGSYILNVLDELGFHDETRGGYEFYLQFRVGDERFSSPDENDQLGTVLHVLRRRLDLCRRPGPDRRSTGPRSWPWRTASST